MQSFLIKFLLLLSASLSVHSAIALPLSAALAHNYHAVAQSDKDTVHFNTKSVFTHFSYKQYTHSKLQASLLTLLQQNPDDKLIYALFIESLNALNRDLEQINTQSEVRQLYQEQVDTHSYILGVENTSYRQKISYQAKRQLQQTS
jgi:hypothetical protein